MEGMPPALREAIAAHARGAISAPVALMRALLSGLPAAELLALLERTEDPRAAPLREEARRRRGGLAVLERMVRAGADHGAAAPSAEAGIAAARAMFDRLVGISPEASVAAYSLGDPALLAAATQEIVDWLRGRGLLAGRPAVLDLGCGIGRLAAALAPEVGGVVGLDASPGMIAAARARCAGIPGLRFVLGSGRDLSGLPDAAFDLVLAVDVFPYLVQAGADLAAAHVAEAARVLRPAGGSLVILNYSYRGLAQDRMEVRCIASRHGFAVLRDGTRELPLWDGHAFWLRRG